LIDFEKVSGVLIRN